MLPVSPPPVNTWYNWWLENNTITALDAKFWRAQGKDDLTRMLQNIKYEGRAKNVIIFVGDGMGIQTHTMARIYKVTALIKPVWRINININIKY